MEKHRSVFFKVLCKLCPALSCTNVILGGLFGFLLPICFPLIIPPLCSICFTLKYREISALKGIKPKILILSPGPFLYRGLFLSDVWMVLVTLQSCNSLLVVKWQKVLLWEMSHHTVHIARVWCNFQQEGKAMWGVTAKVNAFLFWKLSAITWILSGKNKQHRNQITSLQTWKVELTSARGLLQPSVRPLRTSWPCIVYCKGTVVLKIIPGCDLQPENLYWAVCQKEWDRAENAVLEEKGLSLRQWYQVKIALSPSD